MNSTDRNALSETGFWDLLDMAQKPLVASHSNARAVCDHSRNLTDDQFRAIRDSGGVVGLTIGTIVGSARTIGVVGALLGLVLGCLLTAISPRAEETPVGPGYHR